jgi:hypothetical protein
MKLYKRAGRFSFEMGWFPGEPFGLFQLRLISIGLSRELMAIIGIQIARFFINVNYRLHD